MLLLLLVVFDGHMVIARLALPWILGVRLLRPQALAGLCVEVVEMPRLPVILQYL